MAEIFVFGSNLAGIHGAGSAHHAFVHYGARWGIGEGPTGNSYAIPTKDEDVVKTLPLSRINESVDRFIEYARAHPEHTFKLVAIGCGLAGYTPDQIAPMFVLAPGNVDLPEEFEEHFMRTAESDPDNPPLTQEQLNKLRMKHR